MSSSNCCFFFFFSFFFFFFFFISWRLITLQYCSGFCHTLTWISYGFTCAPHPEPPSHLPPHPILLGHPRALVSCIQPGLVICFTLDNNCCFLTHIQISQDIGKMVSYSHLCQNFPQFVVIHTVKGFGIVNKAEVIFNKSLIQFSFDGRGSVPSLLLNLRLDYGGGSEHISDLLQKVPCMHCCFQYPWPCSKPLLTHASVETRGHSQAKSGSVSCEVTAPFSWVLVCTKFCLCPPRVCFPSPVHVL